VLAFIHVARESESLLASDIEGDCVNFKLPEQADAANAQCPHGFCHAVSKLGNLMVSV
jgi:hypothetical protein